MVKLQRWSRLDWLIILSFAALVILFYWRILTPNPADRQSFPPGDFSAQFWAFATLEARELSAGRLPLWNPYTFAGAPFWADVQSAVFYPPSLLTFILSAPWGFSLFALEVEAVAHFWLAAVLMYLFLRRATRSRAAAVIGGLTFTFSGYLTGYPSQQLAVLETVVWLPLILFFIHRAYRAGIGQAEQPAAIRNTGPADQLHLPSLLLAGLVWGLALLAGHPQSALVIAYLSTAYLLFLAPAPARTKPYPPQVSPAGRRLWLWGNVWRRLVFPALFFLLTGLALAAIQFVPAVEYTRLSVRAAGAYDKMAGGFPLTDLVQLLLPGLVSLYSPLYVGVAGLLLAIWAVFSRTVFRREVWFWAVVALVALLISFGGNTFLYTPLYLIAPGFSIFRGQERWAVAAAFSLSALAGYGFAHLQHARVSAPDPSEINTVPSTARLLAVTRYLFFLALLLTLVSFYGLNDTGWRPDSPFYNLLAAAILLTLLLALAWLLWRYSARFHPALMTVLTAGLICFDLFTANWQTNLYPELPEWHTRMPPAVAAIKQDAGDPDEPFRVYNEFRLYDNYGVPFELEDLWGASPLRPLRYDQFLAPPMPIERAWELLNVKYVISWREELYLPSTIIYQEPAGQDTTYVHRLNTVGPRAWLANQAEIASDAAILEKIADPEFDRWRVALLEPGSEQFAAQVNEAANRRAGQGASPSFASVDPAPQDATYHVAQTHMTPRFTVHSPQSFSLQVTTPEPALLILSEISYPGWQASINGQPAPLLRADYTLRAVPVPPGEFTVSLKFRPASFMAGAAISTLTLLAAVVFLMRHRNG